MKTLATINLDHGKGVGELFYFDGSIWCHEPDGTEYDTETPCSRETAIETIQETWGNPVWDLEIKRGIGH